MDEGMKFPRTVALYCDRPAGIMWQSHWAVGRYLQPNALQGVVDRETAETPQDFERITSEFQTRMDEYHRSMPTQKYRG